MFAYISEKADNRIFNALVQEGFETVRLSPFSPLSDPISSHADMLFCAISETLFVHKDYLCDIEGFERVIKVDEPISDKYPNDVLFNIAIVGNHAFCNTKYASKTILKYLEESRFDIHHVSQGYSHCSICIVSENAIITSDKGISDSAKKAGVDTLVIQEGYISLQPYNYGFIGGTSGYTDNAVYFCGALSSHPDGEMIRNFCKKHGKQIVELTNGPLTDVGGILFK